MNNLQIDQVYPTSERIHDRVVGKSSVNDLVKKKYSESLPSRNTTSESTIRETIDEKDWWKESLEMYRRKERATQ